MHAGHWTLARGLAGTVAALGAWFVREPAAAAPPTAGMHETADAAVPGQAPDVPTEAPPQGPELRNEVVAPAAPAPAGTWTVLGLNAEPYELHVEADGFLPHREDVVVPHVEGWRHDVRLRPALKLPVRFEDADGKALAMMRFGDSVTRYLGVAATTSAPGTRIPNLRGRVVSTSEAGRFLSRELAVDVSIRAVRPALASGPGDLQHRMRLRTDDQRVAKIKHLALGETLVSAGGRDGHARVSRLVDTRVEPEVGLVLTAGTEVAWNWRRGAPRGTNDVLEDAQGTLLYGGSSLPPVTYLSPGTHRLRQGDAAPTEVVVGTESMAVRYGGAR
ncbi:MAG: hypothetical protein GY711_13710 [bacterium]|nr:hypothetical protein [bacterium]